MGRNSVILKGLGRGRLAAVTVGLACLATRAVAHPVTLHMAFISEADDGLTRQSVNALARPDAAHELPPPSDSRPDAEEKSDPSSAVHHVAVHHHRHHARRSAETHAAVAATPGPKPQRPWLMVKLIAFTNWWNGWSEKNLHTTSLDVHLDRPAHPDRKSA